MKCTGHTSDGKPCKKYAMRGQTVCYKHGGAAPQNKRAATRNLAMARAQRMVQLAGVDQDPIEHLLDSLYRQAALVAAYGILVGELADEDLTETNKLGDRKMHTFVVAYERANGEKARIAKLCGDLKVGERQMQVVERLGEQLATLFERVTAVVELSEAQRLQMATAFAKEVAALERPTTIEGREAA